MASHVKGTRVRVLAEVIIHPRGRHGRLLDDVDLPLKKLQVRETISSIDASLDLPLRNPSFGEPGSLELRAREHMIDVEGLRSIKAWVESGENRERSPPIPRVRQSIDLFDAERQGLAAQGHSGIELSNREGIVPVVTDLTPQRGKQGV